MISFARTGLLVRVTLVLASTAFLASSLAKAQDSRLGGFAAATDLGLVAENTVIETDAATYAIKRIELHGSNLTKADLDALLDPKSATSVADRFTKLSAAEIIIPEIAVTTKTVPVQKISYQNIKLSNVEKGKAAAADVEGAYFTLTDEKNGRAEGNYGHIHAQTIDLALAARIANDVRKDDSEPLSLIYESFSVEGFKLNSPGKNTLAMTIGKIAGKNVKARPFATRPSDFQKANNDPVRLARLMKDLLTSMEMEDLIASDIELKSETDGKPVAMSLAKMSMAKFGDAKIDDIDFGTFAIKVKEAAINIDDIDFKNIDFQRLREFSDAKSPETPAPDADANQQTAVFAPSISQFTVSKTKVSIFDENGAPGDIKGAFSIDHFEIDGGQPVAPTHLTATLDHFVFDLAAFKDKELKPLADMGYSKLDLSSRIEMTWNATAEELSIKDVSVNGVGMGAVKIGGLIDNVTKDFFSGDSAAMQAAALGALVKKVELQIDNAGLFEKAIAVQAKSQNKSIEEIKQSYVTTAAIGIPAMLDNRPAAKIVGAALAKFFANPKSFHLVATSADGLGAADFALAKEPSALLDVLDVKATANE
jgi:hypothetical protein